MCTVRYHYKSLASRPDMGYSETVENARTAGRRRKRPECCDFCGNALVGLTVFLLPGIPEAPPEAAPGAPAGKGGLG